MRAPRRGSSGRATTLALCAAGVLVLAAVGLFAWRAWVRGPYEEAAAAWEAGAGAPATLALLDGAERRPGLEGAEAELRGLVLLAEGRVTEAGPVLERARAAGGAGADRQVDLARFGDRLLALGREASLEPLVAHARSSVDPLPPEMLALEGFARHAGADLEGARESYRAALDAGLSGARRSLVEKQLGRAAEQARGGRVPVVLARGGEVLAWRDARTRELVAGPELAALLGGASIEELPGLSADDLDGQVELSLDADLQGRAARLFRRENGAFVALSVPEGEILAAAAETEPEEELAPFAPVFQPGSTLKVLTMATWIEAGLPEELVLPYRCEGNDFAIGGEILYDWAAHGELRSLERALSQSCNTVFAKMGLQLGERKLREALRPLGFGASLEPGAGLAEGEGFELAGGGRVRTGALAAGPLDELRLARTAMGLDATRMSALQAAAIALTLADGGERPPPRFVRRRLNVLGEPIEPAGDPPAPVRAFAAATSARVARAMESVVTDEDGTGRGARSARVPVALKTGTTGGDGEPLSAAFLGFLPAASPELAFGLFTRDSGRSLDVSRRVLGPFLEEAWSARSVHASRSN